MKKDENGFSTTIILTLVAVLALIGAIGWYVSSSGDGKSCGSRDLGNTISADSNQPAESTNDCFEQAFAHCEKATYSIKYSGFDTTAQYSIQGKDAKSGKCRGGYKYTEHSTKKLVGKYMYCELDQSTTPFMTAFSNASSGSQHELEQRCKGPLLEGPLGP